MKYKTTVLGHFSESLDGQTIKTRIITDELIKRFGDDQVKIFNTVGGIIAFIRLFFWAPFLLKESANALMFPAQNAVRVVTPILIFWNRFFKRKLLYCVIGGWLPAFLRNRKGLERKLKQFNCIFVETKTMQRLLENEGFTNVIVMPNCKKLKALKKEDLVYQKVAPFNICTFSRVEKNKGIEEAINVVKQLNEKNNRTIYKLDIYGQVSASEQKWFADLVDNFPDYVKYKGAIAFDKSVEVLKDYFALLFPTKYYTEGIPGTIIDAYGAGLPVIASRWLNFDDVIEDGKTGRGFDFGDYDSLLAMLTDFANNPDLLLRLRVNCLTKYNYFSPDYVVNQIIGFFM